ncbi:hypothetical protein [Rhizobium rhizogenes]|uniref:hypothetical protein n=1 Tax=Rhizobium rhizogenes TaxID=359 RepID=UPI0024BEB717|nr:hypothetical protein [Rhizobium rhizogenes]MDJ1632655.1 hypothetical protein [Rhizobium rhizogenes]
MFRDNTVFVIGAGASAEFGMPVGSQLMETIRHNCAFQIELGRLKEGQPAIFRHLMRDVDLSNAEHVDQANAKLLAMGQIAESIDMAESIDEYIFRFSDQPQVMEMGKLQIAFAIASAEKSCFLSKNKGFDSGVGFSAANQTWIYTFAKALCNGVRRTEVKSIGSNITIICFNYDRCIEWYLEHALVHAYPGLDPQLAREIVSEINIIHPYGWLGALKDFPLGDDDRFPEMAENLITWSESMRDPQVKERMGHAVSQAETIVFLGFAFARQNMDLLRTEEKDGTRIVSVFATGFGLEPEAENAYKENICQLYHPSAQEFATNRIVVQWSTKCEPFMSKHRYNLVQ